MNEKELRKKIADALLKARRIVAEHKAEYHSVFYGSGGGGTTTSNTSSTVPQDVLDEYNKVVAQANQVAATPLQQYQGQIVASQNPTETAAYNTINNVQGITAPFTGQASNLISQATQNINPNTVTSADIQNYLSPYTQNVLNSTIAEENNQDAQQQEQLKGNAISSGAWGGDRSGVAQGILGGQQALANNATNAGILNAGYTQALQEANTQQQAKTAAQQASQYLQESGALATNQLGTSALANTLTGAGAQLTAGQQQQQQAQAELNVPYEQFLQQQAYPFQTTGWLGNIAEGIGSNEGGTSTSSTTQPSQGPFGFSSGGTVEGDGIVRAYKHGGYKKGGIVPHFDAGGTDPNADALAVLDPDGGYDNQPRNYSAMEPLPQTTINTDPEGLPAPTPPVNAPDHPINSGYETEMPTPHEANPWLAVAAGVLGTLAGRSRNPLIDIGQGGLIGLNNYAQQQQIAEKQNYEEGSFHQNAQKLMDERDQVQQQFAQEKQKEADTQEYRKRELENQAKELGLKTQQVNQGKVAVNSVTGRPYWTTGKNVGQEIAGTENPVVQQYAANVGVTPLPYTSREDAKKSADTISSANDVIAPINDSILSLQRVKQLLPTIDQGKMAQAERFGAQVLGEGTPERAAYEELQKLEGNAALQNEVANGIKGRALGFNMVKLGQGLFANPEMAKDAQNHILDKALLMAETAKNANEVIQPFEGHSSGTINQVKQKYYNDSLSAGYAIPTSDYLSGTWKQQGYKAPASQQTYSVVPAVAAPAKPGDYSHLWGGGQ